VTILAALELLWDAQKVAPSLRSVPEFVFDLVELTRQLLANRMLDIYLALISVYSDSSSTAQDVAAAGQPILDLFSDLDALLYTNENYLLSTWIADAKQWAHGNASYATYLEYQARNQITLWGPTAGPINDYASKQWAGLVGEYHAERYRLFIAALSEAKASGEPFNATQFAATISDVGQAFDLKIWGTEPGETWGTKGDTFGVIQVILQRWI
jgi:alpha-N-acetylglucosaminidase